MNCEVVRDDIQGSSFYLCTDASDNSIDDIVSEVMRLTGDAPFRLVVVRCSDWNTDYSPWTAPPVFGREGFGGGGETTLRALGELVESDGRQCYIAGYSLAGLFALWSLCQTPLFHGAASCSGSLWFPGWLRYLREKTVEPSANVYISLGDKEELTRNSSMASVGDNTRETFSIISNQCNATLEMNKGGHFCDPALRIAKGIAWLIDQEKKVVTR